MLNEHTKLYMFKNIYVYSQIKKWKVLEEYIAGFYETNYIIIFFNSINIMGDNTTKT